MFFMVGTLNNLKLKSDNEGSLERKVKIEFFSETNYIYQHVMNIITI